MSKYHRDHVKDNKKSTIKKVRYGWFQNTISDFKKMIKLSHRPDKNNYQQNFHQKIAQTILCNHSTKLLKKTQFSKHKSNKKKTTNSYNNWNLQTELTHTTPIKCLHIRIKNHQHQKNTPKRHTISHYPAKTPAVAQYIINTNFTHVTTRPLFDRNCRPYCGSAHIIYSSVSGCVLIISAA